MSMESKEKESPWRQKDLLKEHYVDQGLTITEIADKFGCSHSTVYRWLNNHGIEVPGAKLRVEGLDDKELLERLYIDEDMTQSEIAERYGCSATTVRSRLKKLGIEKKHDMKARLKKAREQSNKGPATFYTDKRGYELTTQHVGIHRLAAVAWFGYEAIVDKEVHHKNHIPFDNREENLELLSSAEHSKQHALGNKQSQVRPLNLNRSECSMLLKALKSYDGPKIGVNNIIQKLESFDYSKN